MIAWWIESLERSGSISPRQTTSLGYLPRLSLIVVCAGAILFNFFYLPRKAIRDCADDSMRATAAQINRIVGRDEPLYSYKLGDEPATLLFYLDRDAPPITTRLGDAPPGYVIAPADVWRAEKDSVPEWTPVFQSTSGNPRVVLLRHGAGPRRHGGCKNPGSRLYRNGNPTASVRNCMKDVLARMVSVTTSRKSGP